MLVDPNASIPDVRSWRIKNVEFQTHRPHTGTQVRLEKFEEVSKKGKKITPEDAQKLWQTHQDSAVRTCSHMFWEGHCKAKTVGQDCEVSANF